MHSFMPDWPSRGRGSARNPSPALSENATGALGEDATGALEEDFVLDTTTRALDDEGGALGSLRDYNVSVPSDEHTRRVSSLPPTALDVMVRPN